MPFAPNARRWRPLRPRHACQLLAAALLALLLGLGLGAPALAQDAPYDAVQRQSQAGDWPAALAQADAWLAQHPADAQMRFMRAVLLQRMGQTEAAQAAFTALVQEHPELPEPHNNLGVLHAAAGRLLEAQLALEQALRLHPHYATGWRNLGDVQLQRAAEAYRRALEQTPHAPGLAQRLQALEALLVTTAPAR